ncbi:MAG: NifB/NifX family molybdenum-iron cluster-binding protein, partial [Desulfobacteraceae bacterium]|nr:NifB/NifX family molybdenum-iron cluster-binding protein [Desulfobacteraceae bacterium]
MKVAVSSSGKNLDASIDQRFGRCAYFLMVETDDMSFEIFDNESAALGGGAGIQSAQFVISKGAGAVITGNCGPNAVQVLAAVGMDVFLSVTGTIKAAVEMYKSGNLTPAGKANVAEYSGLS